jgi:hypothetical protein
MNVDWNGSEIGVVFGDFWWSKKGNPCFRPKSPLDAQHLLICVNWGGAFEDSRGNYPEYAEEVGALYFCRASSNGGGEGCDYWVLPVGFTRVIYDPEIDGDAPEGDTYTIDTGRAKEYRQRHADQHRREVEEAEEFLRQEAADEAEALRAKETLLPRIEAVQAGIGALRERWKEEGRGDVLVRGAYLEIDCVEYLISDESVAEAEAQLRYLEKLEATALRYKEIILGQFAGRLAALDWTISFELRVFIYQYRWGLYREHRYNEDSLNALAKDIEEAEAKRAQKAVDL